MPLLQQRKYEENQHHIKGGEHGIVRDVQREPEQQELSL